MCYASVVWGQNPNGPCKRINILQKRAIRLMTFSSFRAHSSPIFKQLKLIKLMDQIQCQNVLLIHQILNDRIPEELKSVFGLIPYDHCYSTRTIEIQDFRISRCDTNVFGKF